MNLGLGVHIQPHRFIGALLVFVGWCLWLYAFHLCVRRNLRKQKLIIVIVLAVPIVLATFGGIAEFIHDELDSFYLYLLAGVLLLAGATRIVSKQSYSPERGKESVP